MRGRFYELETGEADSYAGGMRHEFSLSVRRRDFLTLAGLGAGAVLMGLPGSTRAQGKPSTGKLKQAVCRGVFKDSKLDLEGMCKECARLGLFGIDLVGPETFPTLKKYGLAPTMVPGGSGIKEGINNKDFHAAIQVKMLAAIKAAAEAGAPNVIVLAGDRKGLTDEQGADNSVLFLNKVRPAAEDAGVTLCMELLNSKVNHPGYMCDTTKWGVEVCKRVDSPRVKLLYDIYHMQIMEGDVIRTIRENIKYIGHFHTAGNPGRHEFDETQELNYSGICRAIAELNFEGYLAHEYTPTKDAVPTLEKMVAICKV